MKKIFLFLVVAGLFFSLFLVISANAEIDVKVDINTLDPITEWEEKIYGQDFIGLGVDGEEPFDAKKAYEVVDSYYQYYYGYRYAVPWDKDVFKSPLGSSTMIMGSLQTKNGLIYFLEDTYSLLLEKDIFVVKYTLTVFNDKQLKIGSIAFPFFLGSVIAVPKEVVFKRRELMAPPKWHNGKEIATWGSLKARR